MDFSVRNIFRDESIGGWEGIFIMVKELIYYKYMSKKCM